MIQGFREASIRRSMIHFRWAELDDMNPPELSNAMVIDNRSNKEGDFHEAIAVTAVGKVEEVGSLEKEQLKALYLAKHPGLLDFVQSPTCALLKIEVEIYYIVRQFQQVMKLHITP